VFVDEALLVELGSAAFTPAELIALGKSRFNDRKMALFAATPLLHGLQLWITGADYVLLDEKGYLCSTTDQTLTLRLCRFESLHGPGTTRALLRQPVVDPTAAVFFVEAKKRVPLPPNVPSTRDEKRALSPSVFAELLRQI